MSSSATSVEARPTSVTVTVVLGWISVIADVAVGISLIVLAGNESVLSALEIGSDDARTYGIVSLAFAVLVAVAVYLLGKGSNISRMLVSIVMALRVGFGIWAIIALGSHHLAEAIITIAIAVVVLALLWNESANRFFASNNP